MHMALDMGMAVAATQMHMALDIENSKNACMLACYRSSIYLFVAGLYMEQSVYTGPAGLFDRGNLGNNQT